MERTVTLRIRSDDAPELVPPHHRRIGDWIIEATLPYEKAEALFLREEERRREGRALGITWFAVHNAFTEREIAQARWFHAWFDRSHHQIANRDDGLLPGCPVCGIAMAVEICPVIPASPLVAPLALASDGVWLATPSLAAWLAQSPWEGLAMTPAFTSRRRRQAYLERRDLARTATTIPIGTPIPAELRPLLLEDPMRATDADRWVLCAVRASLDIAAATPMGVRPGTRVALPRQGEVSVPSVGSLAFSTIASPSPCGHLLAQRLLGPLEIEDEGRLAGDLVLTRQGVGIERGGFFRPHRERLVSRRLAEALWAHGVRSPDLQPLRAVLT